MKVGFDVGPLKPRPAGVGIYVRSLANALADELPPGSLTFIGRRPDATGLPEGVAAADRRPRVPYPAWALLASGAAASRARVDIVHMTDGLAPLVRRPGRLVVSVLDLTLVERPRDHQVPRYLRIPFLLLSPRLADAVVVPSEATARSVRRRAGVASSRIHVVPLAPRPGFGAVDPAVDADVLGRRDLQPGRYVLVPGTIEPRKNPMGSLRAFEHLAAMGGRRDADVRLVFAGSLGWGTGPFRRALSESRVSSRVMLLGYVPDADLPALMRGAAAVLYPSFAEGFGLPVVEAMASGGVVVTSNISSLPEVAGDAGIQVDPHDPAAMARGLADVLSLSAADRRAAEAASLARAARFTWTATAKATAALYEA